MKFLHPTIYAIILGISTFCAQSLLGSIVSVSAWYKKDAHTDRLVTVIGDSPNFDKQIDTLHTTQVQQFLGAIAAGRVPTHLIIEGPPPSDSTIARYAFGPDTFTLHQALQCKARQFRVQGNLTQALSSLGGMHAHDMSRLFSMLENSEFLEKTSYNMLSGRARALSIEDLASYAQKRGANLEEFNGFLKTMQGVKEKFFAGPWEQIKRQVLTSADSTTASAFLTNTETCIANLEKFINARHDDQREKTVLYGDLTKLKNAYKKAHEFFQRVLGADLNRPCLGYLLTTIERERNFDNFLAINQQWLQTLVFDLNEAGFVMELLDPQKPQRVIMFLDRYSAVSLGEHLDMLGFTRLDQTGLEDAQMNGQVMPNEQYALTPQQLHTAFSQVLSGKYPTHSSGGWLQGVRTLLRGDED